MEKRYLIFFAAALAVFAANMALMRWLAPEPRPAPAKVAARANAEGAAGPVDDQPAANRPSPDPGEPQPTAAKVEAPVAAAATVETYAPRWATLGSLDPTSPFRMLVTLSSAGGAIERIELNGSRYHESHWDDRHDREDVSGYLGNLALARSENGPGVVVRVVGPGTPADLAGVKVGDVLTAIDDQPLKAPFELTEYLRRQRRRAGQTVQLAIAGREKPLAIPLRPRPLQVVQPEADDPLSLVTTFESIGTKKVAVKDEELPGLTLRQGHWKLLPSDDPNEVVFARPLPQFELELVKRYRLAPLSPEAVSNDLAPAFHLEFAFEIRNTGANATQVAYRLDGPNGLPTEGSWYLNKKSRRYWMSPAGLRDVYVGQLKNGFPRIDSIDTRSIVEAPGATHWQDFPVVYAGVDSQYFTAALLPVVAEAETAQFADVQTAVMGAVPVDPAHKNATNVTCRLISRQFEVPAGETITQTFKLFAGPKRPRLLDEYGLGDTVYYGELSTNVARVMLAILHFLYSIVPNYGIAIVLLTVLVRSCLFPISRRQALNMQKMQALQPEIKRLKEKHGKDIQAFSNAQRELYAKHKFNPFSGCLPMFLQLPVFIGLYSSLSIDVELRQAPLISESVRWCSNLAAPDMLWYWQHLLPGFFSATTGWLGPYLNVLPLVTVALFVVQQRISMPPPADEQQELQQKMMNYMMLFMGVMFFKVASGLCIYFIASSLWGLAEKKLIARSLPPPPTMLATTSSNGLAQSGGRRPQRGKK